MDQEPLTAEDCNLDGFVSPDELTPWTCSYDVPAIVREYAVHKQIAMKSRLSGDIQTALDEECICDRIYKRIPDEWKW